MTVMQPSRTDQPPRPRFPAWLGELSLTSVLSVAMPSMAIGIFVYAHLDTRVFTVTAGILGFVYAASSPLWLVVRWRSGDYRGWARRWRKGSTFVVGVMCCVWLVSLFVKPPNLDRWGLLQFDGVAGLLLVLILASLTIHFARLDTWKRCALCDERIRRRAVRCRHCLCDIGPAS